VSWAAVQRRSQEWWLPTWLNAWRVRASRRRRSVAIALGQTPQQLFIDLSVIFRHDAGTGIQRVVRSVATALVTNPPTGWVVVPVAATRKRQYHPIPWPQTQTLLQISELTAGPGNVFLGLDFALDSVHRYRSQLSRLKNQGLHLWFVMYDLLPTQRPEWFSDALVVRYRKWLHDISGLADGFFCISPDVASNLRSHLVCQYGLAPTQMPTINVFPMGWEIRHAPHSEGISPEFECQITKLAGQKNVLMVGTLEPRKGHAQALAAFDNLWLANEAINLIIAGRAGWKTEALQEMLRHHPMSGRRLFWFENASDEEVERLYETCSGVLVASHAEGFGLPIIEALGHGKPVLVRDIPVFRTLFSSCITYFQDAVKTAELASIVLSWLSQARSCKENNLLLQSWDDSANHIAKLLQERCHTWV